ncbi:MAG: Peptidase [Gemmatimonadetes bacterium]|nr:Peptidase [Gemmatimonadota bacterium]
MRPRLFFPLVLVLGACAHRGITVIPSGAPVPAPVVAPAPAPAGTSASAAAVDLAYAESRALVVPVAGIRREKLRDSFEEGRDLGVRVHHAMDILAPRNTPILAADDGRVVRLSNSALGGISIYAVDPETRLVYYYAHLERYADSLHVGQVLARGDTIGFVGTTGNAPKDTPHLHFQVMRMPADHKGWNGEPINPFLLLRPDSRNATSAAAGHTP